MQSLFVGNADGANELWINGGNDIYDYSPSFTASTGYSDTAQRITHCAVFGDANGDGQV